MLATLPESYPASAAPPGVSARPRWQERSWCSSAARRCGRIVLAMDAPVFMAAGGHAGAFPPSRLAVNLSRSCCGADTSSRKAETPVFSSAAGCRAFGSNLPLRENPPASTTVHEPELRGRDIASLVRSLLHPLDQLHGGGRRAHLSLVDHVGEHVARHRLRRRSSDRPAAGPSARRPARASSAAPPRHRAPSADSRS